MFQAITHGITIKVRSEFLARDSWPSAGRFAFTYHVEIHNGSRAKVQLLRRYWRIVDGFNRLYDVEGEGVLGLQPDILPLQAHHYSSICPLGTPQGKMSGHYLMNGAERGVFIAHIPEFTLISPYDMPEE